MLRSVDLLVWGPRADRNVTSEIPAGEPRSCRNVTLGFPSNHLCWSARYLRDEVLCWAREPIGSSVSVCFEASSSVCQMYCAKGGLMHASCKLTCSRLCFFHAMQNPSQAKHDLDDLNP
jgi:hypothetical protein